MQRPKAPHSRSSPCDELSMMGSALAAERPGALVMPAPLWALVGYTGALGDALLPAPLWRRDGGAEASTSSGVGGRWRQVRSREGYGGRPTQGFCSVLHRPPARPPSPSNCLASLHSPSAHPFAQLRQASSSSHFLHQQQQQQLSPPGHRPASAAAAAGQQQPTAPAAAAPAGEAGRRPVAPARLDMEALMKVLITPMPLGRVRNQAFGDAVVQLDNSYFFDPARTLSSTMRALHAVQQVLAGDGHVYVVNSNPAMRPLLREAAYLCLNSNVWFWAEPWVPGAISDPVKSSSLLFSARHQPSRELLGARGAAALRNPHCGRPPVTSKPSPSLPAADRQWLVSKLAERTSTAEQRDQRRSHKELLRNVVQAEIESARLRLPNAATGRLSSSLALVLVLDLSYGAEAVREAAGRNIMTASLLNAHSDLSDIHYPIYASEFHPRFQHFFLEWLLRVANLPPTGTAAAAAPPRGPAASAAAGPADVWQ